eukprot:m.37968 g.37968  ORF g.37968 m.37968 type:complete len:413 (-) comp13702_c0_seq1:45-1283(-)
MALQRIKRAPQDLEEEAQLPPRRSLSELFQLHDHIGLLKTALAGTGAAKRLAWLGDSLFAAVVAEDLFAAHPAADPGELSLLKARYTCNRTMATFLLLATDADSRVAPGLSEHSLGTLLEALLGATFQTQGRAAAVDIVRHYQTWIDQHDSLFDFPTAAAEPMQVLTFPDNTLPVAQAVEEKKKKQAERMARPADADSAGSRGKKSKEADDEEPRGPRDPKPCLVLEGTLGSRSTQNHTKFMQAFLEETAAVAAAAPESRDASHEAKPVPVCWYSRRGLEYNDSYFPCCGVREGRKVCLRSLWPDALAKHHGNLYIGGSRRCGGGHPQYYANHIPRGNTPTWTCCHKVATAPGCFSDLYKDDSTAYSALIASWLQQHDELVRTESDVPVTWGGVAADSIHSVSGKWPFSLLF